MILDEKSNTARMLRLREVLRKFPVSRSLWWAGVKSGKFPAGHKLSDRCVAWLESDIDALIASKAGV
jgi:prophage regulatory protein